MNRVLTEREINNLGFEEIRTQLADLAVTPMARERALGLMPSADYAAISRKLAETSEARLIVEKGSFTQPAVADIGPFLNRWRRAGC